jgi:hypothetical protein
VDDREDAQRDEIGEGWLDAVEAKLFARFKMKAKFLSTPYMGLLNEDGTDIRFYAGYLRSKDSQTHNRVRLVVGGRVHTGRLGVHVFAHRICLRRVAGHV